MHYFDFNIKSYQAATSHLTNEEDLTYRRLIEMYYDTEQPIPTDTPVLTRRLRVGLPSLESVLKEFFQPTANGWIHPYCDAVIAEYHAYTNRQRINGSKGGRAKKASANPVPSQNNPVPSQQETINNKPVTTNQEPLKSKAKTIALATRLPADWRMGDEEKLFCKQTRPDLIPQLVADGFRDYWIAVPGAKGCKADWSATWRNWVRNQNAPRQTGKGNGGVQEARLETARQIMGGVLGIISSDEIVILLTAWT